MQKNLESLLPFVTKASRYLGNEINAVRKDPASVDLTFAFAFPDAYEVGMSHLGLQILYNVLNGLPRVACERAFAPWPDMEAEMKAAGVPLATLESGTPLASCDIVGFSLEYELCYATVLRMLDLAGIPLEAAARDGSWPLVIGGGPSVCNPEPVADFFDAFVIGEGEEVLQELCHAVSRWKKSRRNKAELLDALAEIPGIYVPSFFSVDYRPDGAVAAIRPLKKGYDHVDKRIVANFTDAPWCAAPVVPYMQIIHDRAGIEIARGCSRGCRFCMAGMIYRPVREKNVDRLCGLCRETLAGTGYEELGLLSLSSGDYSRIQPLMSAIIREHGSRKTALSLPSLRIESLTQDMIREIKQIRKTGFTIAPEAGTQRLRNAINKGFTDEEILATASRIFESGWNLIKLYFMIGLPTETDADIQGIVKLCRDIARLDRRKNLHISISTFVPKPHTPFQWDGCEPSGSIAEKQQYLKESLRSRTVQVKYHDRRLSLLEAVFSRGDRRLAGALVAAKNLGAGFDAWSEHFSYGVWEQALASAGADKDIYLREKAESEVLPWEHIRYGLSRDFLLSEREKSRRGETTADCRSGPCTGCGACPATGARPEASRPAEAFIPEPDAPPPADQAYRYRILYAKEGPARFISHLEFSSSFFRSLRRAGLPLRYSQGFHPLPRATFHEALSVGVECRGARCDLELAESLEPSEILERLVPQLPPGVAILSVDELVGKGGGPQDGLKTYAISFPPDVPLMPDRAAVARSLDAFRARDSLFVQVEKKGALSEVDLKQRVAEVRLEGGGQVVLKMIATGGGLPKITDIAGALFGLGQRERRLLRITSIPS